MNLDSLRAQLTIDEGKRNRPYRDSLGNLTAGVGRNLDAVPFSDDEIALMLNNDIQRAIDLLDGGAIWWRTLDDDRQDALLNMAFNMGAKIFGFKQMIAALQLHDYTTAANEMLDSLWAKEVGARATRLADVIRGSTT